MHRPRATDRAAAIDAFHVAAPSLAEPVAARGPDRRTLLTSLAVGTLALVAGCDVRSRGADDTPPDPDVALLERVRDSTSTLLSRVQTLDPGEEPGWASVPLGTLAACLATQLSVLDPESGSTPAPAEPSPSAASPSAPSPSAPSVPTVAGLEGEVKTHVTLLTDAAGRAESGTFARLLASAVAGLTQHLASPGPDGTRTEEKR